MGDIRKVRTEEDYKPLTISMRNAAIEAARKENSKATIFTNANDRSRFVFASGKEVAFSAGVYATDDEQEIKELRAAIKTSGMITEQKGEIENPEVSVAENEGKQEVKEPIKPATNTTNPAIPNTNTQK